MGRLRQGWGRAGCRSARTEHNVFVPWVLTYTSSFTNRPEPRRPG